MRELHKRVFTTSKSVTIGTAPNHYQPTSQKVKRVSKGLFPPKTHSHQLREAAQTLSAPSSKNLWLVVRELTIYLSYKSFLWIIPRICTFESHLCTLVQACSIGTSSKVWYLFMIKYINFLPF